MASTVFYPALSDEDLVGIGGLDPNAIGEIQRAFKRIRLETGFGQIEIELRGEERSYEIRWCIEGKPIHHRLQQSMGAESPPVQDLTPPKNLL